MLVPHLYRMSLEEPGHWPYFIGLGGRSELLIESLRIERLDAYIFGFTAAERVLQSPDYEARDFSQWLFEEGGLPRTRWHLKLLDDAGGSDEQALRRFFGLLHQYLLQALPEWFVEFNRSERPSMIGDADGVPSRADVRLPDHIRAAEANR